MQYAAFSAAHPVLDDFFALGPGWARGGFPAREAPSGEVISLDPFLNDLRRLADGRGAPEQSIGELLLEDDCIVVKRVVTALLAELLHVLGEFLVELGRRVVEQLAELGKVFGGGSRLEAGERGSFPSRT